MTDFPIPEGAKRAVFKNTIGLDAMLRTTEVFHDETAVIGLDPPYGMFDIGADKISLQFRVANGG